MEPLDFEEFILQNQPLADENTDIAVLSEFPDDDIEITNIQRKARTVGQAVPDLMQWVPFLYYHFTFIKSFLVFWFYIYSKIKIKKNCI